MGQLARSFRPDLTPFPWQRWEEFRARFDGLTSRLVGLGLGRILALYHRSSTSYHIR
jgi:hypothetical protein